MKRSPKKVVGDRVKATTRRICKLGNSHYIAIPSEFLIQNDLKADDEVGIVFDHILKVVPVKEID